MNLNFIPVKTRLVRPPQDDITDILDSLTLEDGDIVFVTSKILGIHQGRTVKTDTIKKEDLIRKEADRFLFYDNTYGNFHVHLTITQDVLIPAAGIDESNADGHYIMWPRDIDGLCRAIRTHLIKKNHLKHLGVIATDSHTTPLRWGVTGVTVGLAGVEPLKDIRGTPDLFGRTMHITKVNLIDPLTSMAVLLMGESNECTPIIILRGYTGIPFSDNASMQDFKITPEDDLYSPLLAVIPKKEE